MGQISSFLKAQNAGFERVADTPSPANNNSRKKLVDPRSPTNDITRTPIAASADEQTPKGPMDSPKSRFAGKTESMRQRLLRRKAGTQQS